MCQRSHRASKQACGCYKEAEDLPKSYDQKRLKFETFTSQVQDDAGAPRMSALPASSQTVVAYLGYLLKSGSISVKSLQPHLSAINVVQSTELQGSSMLQPQQVTAFPAEPP
jgi:hypothetical protein